jgi:hypothetical protein
VAVGSAAKGGDLVDAISLLCGYSNHLDITAGSPASFGNAPVIVACVPLDEMLIMSQAHPKLGHKLIRLLVQKSLEKVKSDIIQRSR